MRRTTAWASSARSLASIARSNRGQDEPTLGRKAATGEIVANPVARRSIFPEDRELALRVRLDGICRARNPGNGRRSRATPPVSHSNANQARRGCQPVGWRQNPGRDSGPNSRSAKQGGQQSQIHRFVAASAKANSWRPDQSLSRPISQCHYRPAPFRSLELWRSPWSRKGGLGLGHPKPCHWRVPRISRAAGRRQVQAIPSTEETFSSR